MLVPPPAGGGELPTAFELATPKHLVREAPPLKCLALTGLWRTFAHHCLLTVKNVRCLAQFLQKATGLFTRLLEAI